MRTYKAGWDYKVEGGPWQTHTQYGLYDEVAQQIQLDIHGITLDLLGMTNPQVPVHHINLLVFDCQSEEVLVANVHSLPVTESWRSEYLEAVFEHERT